MMKIHPAVRRAVVLVPFLAMAATAGAGQWRSWQHPAEVTTQSLVSSGYQVLDTVTDPASALDPHLKTVRHVLSDGKRTYECLDMIATTATGAQTTQYSHCAARPV